MHHRTRYHIAGFTLIELSIVLVIIGLIIGGVLMGQDLIKAAEIRATVSQYEKLNASVNTFRTKYGGVPGDLLNTEAAAFGFFSNGMDGSNTRGDGDGLVEGASFHDINVREGLVFWRHLSDADLIEANLGTSLEALGAVPASSPSGDEVAQYLPPSKIRPGHFMANSTGGFNHYLLAHIRQITPGGATDYAAALSPIETYNIDTKVDDGAPNTGIAIARGTVWPFSSLGIASWSASPTAECMTGSSAATSPTTTYNRDSNTGGNSIACNLRLRFN